MSLQKFTREYNRRMNEPRKPKEQKITAFHWAVIGLVGLGYGMVFAMFIAEAFR